MQAYCMKCKKKVDIKEPKDVTLKNGRQSIKGVCSDCGTKVVCIVNPKKKQIGESTPPISIDSPSNILSDDIRKRLYDGFSTVVSKNISGVVASSLIGPKINLTDDFIKKLDILSSQAKTNLSSVILSSPVLRSDYSSYFRYNLPTAYGVKEISSSELNSNISKEQELKKEIDDLTDKNRELVQEIIDKRGTQKKLKEKVDELNDLLQERDRKITLQHLLYKVNENAKTKLLKSKEFQKLFEETESCHAVILALDIRRSTELMLKARGPQLYAEFIRGLCAQLTGIILHNYGVFDKFTGDGILAFFPDFYSGKDAPYLAIKAAEDCHGCFKEFYKDHRSCFTSILIEVGLGIGIDCGKSHLIKIQDELTVIGTPVVYACRLSGAMVGQTLLNQPAYEVASKDFGGFLNFQETEIDIKHEGRTVAYSVNLSKMTYKPSLPDWVDAD